MEVEPGDDEWTRVVLEEKDLVAMVVRAAAAELGAALPVQHRLTWLWQGTTGKRRLRATVELRPVPNVVPLRREQLP